MNGTRNNHSRSRGSSRASSRSKLYERYDVNIKASSRGRGWSRWFNNDEGEGEGDHDDAPSKTSRQHVPIEERTNLELCKIIWRNATVQSRTILILLAAAALYMSKTALKGGLDSLSSSSTTNRSAAADSSWTARNSWTDPDSHKRSNPFAPEGHVSVMEGAIEVKRVGKRKQSTPHWMQEQEEQELVERDGDGDAKQKKRWNPCTNTKFELERHDHEPRHGDVCRAKGGLMGLYECPEGCHDVLRQPYCANDEPQRKSANTFGERGAACRVRNPDAPPEYRCDAGSVCIMAVGMPKEQFKGEGEYYDDTCDDKCVDGRTTARKCTSDMDCSLAGVCSPDGKCECDPWTEGPDCSYLKFAPVDKSRLGYLNERHSSWGGSIVQGSDGMYHMFTSEILCKDDPDARKRCGLNNWETHSRIARAMSANIDGPYRKTGDVLPPEHHNPSVHVSPKTGVWHLFSISGPTGPIVRMVSSNEGKTWSVPMAVSPRQNPGPLLHDDGSASLFYRADGMDLPSPTCSDEGISFVRCPSEDGPCDAPNDDPIFGHTGEDPSVFVDHRGNYHMLFNALPYKCVPKFRQGGHSWSIDGVTWSEPRVGAFDTTVRFADGSSVECERRERPQMVTDRDGRPAAMVSGVTGCPNALGDASLDGDGRFYKGADDCFTLVQKMNS